MTQHLIEVYSVDGAREPLVSVTFPDKSTFETLDAAKFTAKSAVEQMLARLGVRQELMVVHVPNVQTAEESRSEMDAVHLIEAEGGHLPSTEEALANRL